MKYSLYLVYWETCENGTSYMKWHKVHSKLTYNDRIGVKEKEAYRALLTWTDIFATKH